MNDVPILAGITADETFVLLPRFAGAVSRAKRLIAAKRSRALSGHRRRRRRGKSGMASDRDRRHGWPGALGAHAHGGAPLYLYLWAHPLPGPDAARYRAFHSSELIYMFGSFAAAPQRTFTERDRAISERMLDYWANFVRRRRSQRTAAGDMAARGGRGAEVHGAWRHASRRTGAARAGDQRLLERALRCAAEYRF